MADGLSARWRSRTTMSHPGIKQRASNEDRKTKEANLQRRDDADHPAEYSARLQLGVACPGRTTYAFAGCRSSKLPRGLQDMARTTWSPGLRAGLGDHG